MSCCQRCVLTLTRIYRLNAVTVRSAKACSKDCAPQGRTPKLGKPYGPSTEYQYAPSLRTTAPTVREMMRISSPMDQLSTYEMS